MLVKAYHLICKPQKCIWRLFLLLPIEDIWKVPT
jgi:hypothetical protein